MKQGIFKVTANEELTEGVMRMVLTGDTADISGPDSLSTSSWTACS